MRHSQEKDRETLREFFGIKKRTEAPYCSVVCCQTESPEKSPNIDSSVQDIELSNSEQKVIHQNILKEIKY